MAVHIHRQRVRTSSLACWDGPSSEDSSSLLLSAGPARPLQAGCQAAVVSYMVKTMQERASLHVQKGAHAQLIIGAHLTRAQRSAARAASLSSLS